MLRVDQILIRAADAFLVAATLSVDCLGAPLWPKSVSAVATEELQRLYLAQRQACVFLDAISEAECAVSLIPAAITQTERE